MAPKVGRAPARKHQEIGNIKKGNTSRRGSTVKQWREQAKRDKGKMSVTNADVQGWKKIRDGGEKAQPQHPPVTGNYPVRRNPPGQYDQAIDQILSPDKAGSKPRKGAKPTPTTRNIPEKVEPAGTEVKALVNLLVEPFARLSDKTLDAAYHYGLSQPGSFGWEANQGSARKALELIVSGETNIEKISAAIHDGWGEVAKTFEDPIYQTKPEKRQNRLKLAETPYEKLEEAEKEKDRVVAKALLEAYQGLLAGGPIAVEIMPGVAGAGRIYVVDANGYQNMKMAWNRIRIRIEERHDPEFTNIEDRKVVSKFWETPISYADYLKLSPQERKVRIPNPLLIERQPLPLPELSGNKPVDTPSALKAEGQPEATLVPSGAMHPMKDGTPAPWYANDPVAAAIIRSYENSPKDAEFVTWLRAGSKEAVKWIANEKLKRGK